METLGASRVRTAHQQNLARAPYYCSVALVGCAR